MAAKADVTIGFDKGTLDVIKSTRLTGCMATGCKFNFQADCSLKKIVIKPDGSCKEFEPRQPHATEEPEEVIPILREANAREITKEFFEKVGKPANIPESVMVSWFAKAALKGYTAGMNFMKELIESGND